MNNFNDLQKDELKQCLSRNFTISSSLPLTCIIHSADCFARIIAQSIQAPPFLPRWMRLLSDIDEKVCLGLIIVYVFLSHFSLKYSGRDVNERKKKNCVMITKRECELKKSMKCEALIRRKSSKKLRLQGKSFVNLISRCFADIYRERR